MAPSLARVLGRAKSTHPTRWMLPKQPAESELTPLNFRAGEATDELTESRDRNDATR